MSYGHRPWLQLHWDTRAAANFILGGTGAGLTALAAFAPLGERLHQIAMLAGLALVAAGLASVWMEIGRKLRAVHVFFNPLTSWMTRESFAALALFAIGLSAVWTGAPLLSALTSLAALGFVYCQGRILRASKGIPAWREPTVTWLVFWTAIAEGAGLLLVFAALAGSDIPGLAAGALALAVAARALSWSVYRGRVASTLEPRARAALEPAGKQLYQLGAVAPLALLLAAGAFDAFVSEAAALAGIFTLATGWRFKFVLVVRASFNQGFALPRVPVRGGK